MGTDVADDNFTGAIQLQKQALLFMIEVANAIYNMAEIDRVAVVNAITALVLAMDEFPRELEPQAIYAEDSGRLVLTFLGNHERAPIVVELDTGGTFQN